MVSGYLSYLFDEEDDWAAAVNAFEVEQDF